MIDMTTAKKCKACGNSPKMMTASGFGFVVACKTRKDNRLDVQICDSKRSKNLHAKQEDALKEWNDEQAVTP